METVNVKINLFKFKELEKKAKQKAIDEHYIFLSDIGEAEEDDIFIIENIKANEYLFFKSGKLAQTCFYTKDHPTKAGKHEFTFQDKIYNLSENKERILFNVVIYNFKTELINQDSEFSNTLEEQNYALGLFKAFELCGKKPTGLKTILI